MKIQKMSDQELKEKFEEIEDTKKRMHTQLMSKPTLVMRKATKAYLKAIYDYSEETDPEDLARFSAHLLLEEANRDDKEQGRSFVGFNAWALCQEYAPYREIEIRESFKRQMKGV